MATTDSEQALVTELLAAIERAVAANGGSTQARKPAHRVPFHWPPHPVSYSYHVLASDWSGKASFEAYDESFEVTVARTPYGVFGRCEGIWHEDRGDTEEEMLQNLRASSEPLFQRQLAIGRALERSGRFKGHIRDLDAIDQLKVLYCEDRDAANEARVEIERKASDHVYMPGLLTILNDRRHPNRASAQWCVLDLFEALPTFVKDPDDERQAVEAMKALIWDAEDDYARSVYKAGVVLGGHIPYTFGGPILLECLRAPSRIGRRSAIHGLFHVVEWVPAMLDQVLEALGEVAKTDPEPALRAYAAAMAEDIAHGNTDHVTEPIFPEEG